MTPHDVDEAERNLRVAKLLQAMPWMHPGFMFGAAAGLRSWGVTGDTHTAAWWAGTVALGVYGLGLVMSLGAWALGTLTAWGLSSTQDKADIELGRETRKRIEQVKRAVSP